MTLDNDYRAVDQVFHSFLNSGAGFEVTSRRLINIIVNYLREDPIWLDDYISAADREFLKNIAERL